MTQRRESAFSAKTGRRCRGAIPIMSAIACEGCGKPLAPSPQQRRTCSSACASASSACVYVARTGQASGWANGAKQPPGDAPCDRPGQETGTQATVVAQLNEIRVAGEAIRKAGMRFNAGHALNYFNVQPVAALRGVRELHIGHAIVSRALFCGLREAVRQMKALIREAAA